MAAAGSSLVPGLKIRPRHLLYRFAVLYDEEDEELSLPFAEYLTDLLEDSGYGPGYYASRNMELGNTLVKAKMDEITSSQFIFCVVTEQFLQTRWNCFFNEASFHNVLTDSMNQTGYRRVISILLHENRQTIRQLVRTHAAHLEGIENLYLRECNSTNMNPNDVERIKQSMITFSQLYVPDSEDGSTDEDHSGEDGDPPSHGHEDPPPPPAAQPLDPPPAQPQAPPSPLPQPAQAPPSPPPQPPPPPPPPPPQPPPPPPQPPSSPVSLLGLVQGLLRFAYAVYTGDTKNV